MRAGLSHKKKEPQPRAGLSHQKKEPLPRGWLDVLKFSATALALAAVRKETAPARAVAQKNIVSAIALWRAHDEKIALPRGWLGFKNFLSPLRG